MATSKKSKVTVEIPADLVKLSKKEAEDLKSLFRTQVANMLSAKLPDTLLSITIINTPKTPGGGGGTPLNLASKKAAKKAGKKAGKKAAKKSSKNR